MVVDIFQRYLRNGIELSFHVQLMRAIARHLEKEPYPEILKLCVVALEEYCCMIDTCVQ